jgi:type IV pilus assembly protein PilW
LPVGDNNTLYSYDLLNIAGTTPQAQADGVFELHALYGVPSQPSTSTKVDTWVNPASSSSYAPSVLSNSTTTAAGFLKNIRAIHVALIMRTSLPEKNVVTPGPLTYFTDSSLGTGLAQSRTLSATEQHYRYRVVETTIPVRNNAF